MDAMEKQESGHTAVLSVENEAESTREERSGALDQHDLDTCPVCHLSFHSKEPKLLPCLHTFCERCLPLPSRNLDVTEPSVSQSDDGATKPRESLCLQTQIKDRLMAVNLFYNQSSCTHNCIHFTNSCSYL